MRDERDVRFRGRIESPDRHVAYTVLPVVNSHISANACMLSNDVQNHDGRLPVVARIIIPAAASLAR